MTDGGMLPQTADEAEQALLGAMIVAGGGDVHLIGDVREQLRGPGDFSKPSHQTLYAAISTIYDRSAAVDVTQLVTELRADGTLQQVGGADYLVQLANSVGIAENAPQYARLVRLYAIVRDGWTLHHELGQRLKSPGGDLDDLCQWLEGRVYQITEDAAEQRHKDTWPEALDHTRAIAVGERQPEPGMATGLRAIDAMALLRPGQLWLVAGRPAMGKSVLAAQIACHAAVKLRRRAVLFSLEMGEAEIAARCVAAEALVSHAGLTTGRLSASDQKAATDATRRLAEAPLEVRNTPGLSLANLRSAVRRIASREPDGLGPVIVDYLQLMTPPDTRSRRNEQISDISRGLKALAQEIQAPVIGVSQLNRANTARADHRPQMSDLRDSGSLEQDADTIVLLHREAYYHQHDEAWRIENEQALYAAEAIIAKQRSGQAGVAHLRWLGEYCRFGDTSLADEDYTPVDENDDMYG